MIYWIKSQEARGYSPQQIYNSLIQQGYNPNEVNDAIRIASQPSLSANQYTEAIKKPISLIPFIIIGIVVIALIGGGVLYLTTHNNKETSKPNNNSLNKAVLKNTTAPLILPPAPIPELTEVKLDINCDAFPDKLDSCTKYKCQFIHPFTGQPMVKEIFGLINGKCDYFEQMPNNGSMECNYTESMRKAAAQYYRDVAGAKSAGMEAHVDFGSNKTETKYTIDGKEVSNPLQEAMTDGQCVISGYES